MVDYGKDEYLIISEMWTGTPLRDAVIQHISAVRIDQWGRAFSDQKESRDKKQKDEKWKDEKWKDEKS